VLLGVLIAVSLLGAHMHAPPRANINGLNPRLVTYGATFALEWVLVAWIWWGIGRRGGTLRALIGGRWPDWKSVLRDLGVAVAFMISANLVLLAVAHIMAGSPSSNIQNLLPRGPLETVAALMMTLSAGFCEEIVFRGYLQQQFGRLARSHTLGVLLQAMVFGAAHGYQGLKMMCIIAIYGVMFGMFATWRHSLRPGIIAHVLQDSFAMLFA
jgi:membrane protease YdiL (CAAX protease family)